MTTSIPGLGVVVHEDEWLVTEPRPVPALGASCRFRIDGFEPQDQGNLVSCIEAFCSLGFPDLARASAAVFAYYQDVVAGVDGDWGQPRIATAGDVWNHVRLTNAPLCQHDGATWFVVLENECAWEPEHGLMIVLESGSQVTKVGPFDGHLTNRHAHGDETIPDSAVYCGPGGFT